MIKATKHTPPLVHADVKTKTLGVGESASEEKKESKRKEASEKKSGQS